MSIDRGQGPGSAFEPEPGAPLAEIGHETTGVFAERIRAAESFGELRGLVLESKRRTDERLHVGAETFSEIRRNMKSVETRVVRELDEVKAKIAPKRMTISTLLAIIALVLGPVGMLVWQAARYPDRLEFQEVRRALVEMDRQREDIRRDLLDQRKTLDRLEAAQAAAATKIDLLLLKGKP